MKQLWCMGVIGWLLAAQSLSAMVPVSKSGDDVTTFTTIAGALAVAGSGEEVRVVDQGTYSEALTLSDVKLTAVPAGAIINSDSPADNRLIHISGAGPVEISGFNMYVTTQGHGIQIDATTTTLVTLTQCEVVAPWAGVQLFCESGPAVTQLNISGSYIHDCSVGVDAQGPGDGGFAVTIDGGSQVHTNWEGNIRLQQAGDLTMDGVLIASSGAGPGVQLSTAGQSQLTATDCVFENNAQDGLLGVVNPGAATGSTWTLTGCTLRGNGQSAVQIYSNEDHGLTLSAQRCRFIHNPNAEPVVDLFKADADFVNCLMDHGGDTTNGNMVHLRYGGGEHASFTHCTLVTTNASVNALSLVDGGTAQVTNCIIEAAGAALNTWPPTGPTITHDYNLLRGLLNYTQAAEHEIIDEDPLFLEASSGAGTGNFGLQAASPARGQALELTPAITVDLNLVPRPAAASLGCYEYTPAQPVTASAHWELLD